MISLIFKLCPNSQGNAAVEEDINVAAYSITPVAEGKAAVKEDSNVAAYSITPVVVAETDDHPREPNDLGETLELNCKWVDLIEGQAQPYALSDFKKARVGAEFALMHTVWRDYNKTVTPRIFEKAKKNVWEILDVTCMEMIGEVEDKVINKDGSGCGPSFEYGEIYFHWPTDEQVDAVRNAHSVDQASKFARDDERLQVSPKRQSLRDKAYEAQVKQAKIMKKVASKADDQISVRDIEQLGLHESDQTKVDPAHITAVVVEVTKGGQLRVAVAAGVLKDTFHRGVTVLKPPSNDRVLLGLEDAFNEWQGMSKISVREAARSVSVCGGQGYNVQCNCNGKCESNRCKCKKANVLCSSKCHRGNTCCINHE